MSAAGYLFTTAFAPGGDLTDAVMLMGIPMVGEVAMTMAGFYAIRAAARLVYSAFDTLLPNDGRLTERLRVIREVIGPSVILGTLRSLPRAFPLPHWMSLEAVISGGFRVLWFTWHAKRRAGAAVHAAHEVRAIDGSDNLVPLIVVSALVYVLVMLVERFVLRPGIAF